MTAPPPADERPSVRLADAGTAPPRPTRWAVLRHWAEVTAFAGLGLLSAALAVGFTYFGGNALLTAPAGAWVKALFGFLLAMCWTVPVFCAWSVAWRIKRGAGRDADRPWAPAARFTRRARGLMLAGLCTPLALLFAAGLWIFLNRLLGGGLQPGDPAALRDPYVWMIYLLGGACFLVPLVGLGVAARLLFVPAAEPPAGDGPESGGDPA